MGADYGVEVFELGLYCVEAYLGVTDLAQCPQTGDALAVGIGDGDGGVQTAISIAIEGRGS